MNLLKYLLAGTVFGIVLTKAEAISWFRMYEMFHFRSFHMYGLMGSAVLTGMLSLQLMRRLKMKTLDGETLIFPKREFSQGQIWGGLVFGAGWALCGACPGPLFALAGNGYGSMLIGIAAAVAGTWTYAAIRNKLPH